MELLNQLEPLLRTFWYVAIPTSLIFLLQTILTFAGGHHADGGGFDVHTDGHDGDAFHLFSFRNLINFLLGFSWTGISLYALVNSSIALIIIALGVGVGFVWLFFFLIKQLQRLAEDNTFQLTDTLPSSRLAPPSAARAWVRIVVCSALASRSPQALVSCTLYS